MNPKTRICLTLTVSSGCPTITLDAPVTKAVFNMLQLKTNTVMIDSICCIAL